MKLLIVALCLAAGPNSFVRCGDGDLGDEANVDVKTIEPVNIEDDLVDSENALLAADELKFGSEGRFVANKTDTFESGEAPKAYRDEANVDVKTIEPASIEDDLDDSENALLAADELKFGSDGRFVANKTVTFEFGGAPKAYRAKDTKSKVEVIVKTEILVAEPKDESENPKLLREASIYAKIGQQKPTRAVGIPIVYYNGPSSDKKSYELILQSVGKSLKELQVDIKKKFTEPTVYKTAVQLLYRIQRIHKARFLHRNICPKTVAIGKSGKIIYVFDFEFAEKYIDSNGKHIKEGTSAQIVGGDKRYMSAYAQENDSKLPSRRDDLEAIGFMLMSFLKGSLPWDKETANKKVYEAKKSLDITQFAKGFTPMQDYFAYVRKLDFSTKPDYQKLRKLFRDEFPKMKPPVKEEDAFDWTTSV